MWFCFAGIGYVMGLVFVTIFSVLCALTGSAVGLVSGESILDAAYLYFGFGWLGMILSFSLVLVKRY